LCRLERGVGSVWASSEFSPSFFFLSQSRESRLILFFSLAHAELYMVIATIFTQFDFELYETDITDVEMRHAYLVPYPKWETKGVRVKVTE